MNAFTMKCNEVLKLVYTTNTFIFRIDIELTGFIETLVNTRLSSVIRRINRLQ